MTALVACSGDDVVPGNDAVVHHVIAYIAEPDDVWYYDERDAEELAEGYSCYGSPGFPDGGSSRWLGGWAPGGPVSMFPEGTGIRVSTGSKIVLQLHYNLEEAGPGPDQTRVLVATEPEVTHPSSIQPWADPGWLYSDDSETCLLDVPRWDFNWQRGDRFTEPKLLEAGDALTVECTWDDPTDEDVCWGDGTSDEMCLGTFLVSYPWEVVGNWGHSAGRRGRVFWWRATGNLRSGAVRTGRWLRVAGELACAPTVRPLKGPPWTGESDPAPVS